MEVTITHTQEQPLTQRTDVSARIFFEGPTPNREAIVKALAEKLGCSPDVVVVTQAEMHFGDSTADVKAQQYANVEALKKIAPEYVQNRNTFAAPEPEPAAEAPAEPAAQEAPAEPASEEETPAAE